MRDDLIKQFPILELLQDSEDPQLTPAAVEEIELALGFRFPSDYAQFLVDFNGGEFRGEVSFSLPKPVQFVSGGLVEQILGEPDDGGESSRLTENAEMLDDQLPPDCLAIADCNGSDAVVLKYNAGRTEFAGVWLWDSDARFMGDDVPPLHWLADSFHGFLSLLTYDNCADEEDERETLPMFQAIERGGFRAVQRYLAEGGDIEARNEQGHTLLMAAVIHRWPRIVGLLLERHAAPQARDHVGRTALHHAANHSIDSVKLLLAAGADPRARDNEGKSVLAGWSYRADTILRAHGAEE